MRIKFNALQLLVILVGMLLSLRVMAEAPVEMKPLERFVGTWKMEQTMKTGDGRETTTTGLTTTKFKLGGRFLEFVRISNEGKEEAYGLINYDASKEKYRMWFFGSNGQSSEWLGTWDEATKTLTRTADLGPATGKATSRFIDHDTFEFALDLTIPDGKVVFEVDTKFERQVDARRVLIKQSEKRATSPAELKSLERITGTWIDDVVVKEAEWTPEQTRFKTESKKFWILGGKYVFQELETDIFLTTYSTSLMGVKMWHFSSLGYVHEWTGQWNDSGDELVLKSDLDGDPNVSAVMTQKFTDGDVYDWNAIASDGKGKTYHHMEGESKRKR